MAMLNPTTHSLFPSVASLMLTRLVISGRQAALHYTGYTSFRSIGPAASRPQRLYSKNRPPSLKEQNRTGILKLNGVGTNFGVGIGEAKPKVVRAGDGVLGEGTASPSSPTVGFTERCKLPRRGPGQSPGRRGVSCILSHPIAFPSISVRVAYSLHG